MTTQTQPFVPQPARMHGNRLAWFRRIVNVAVIATGIFCGYSLESRHHASASQMPAVQTTTHAANSTPGDVSVCYHADTEL